MKPIKGLIDADILVYKYGYAATTKFKWTPESNEVSHFCFETAKELIKDKIAYIVEDLKLSTYLLFISDYSTRTFRHALMPDYKGKRPPKPAFVEQLRTWLQEYYSNILIVSTPGLEADDALGIAQDDTTVICSIDKDMLQIPGWHYNINSGKLIEISKLEATKWMFMQTLMGDTVDNYCGVPGIGKVKAGKLLDNCVQSYDGYYWTTLKAYINKGLTYADFSKTLRVAHIYRQNHSIFSPEEYLKDEAMKRANKKLWKDKD